MNARFGMALEMWEPTPRHTTHFRDALDLALAVDHVVKAHALARCGVRGDALRLAEVHVTRQLANHHDVHAWVVVGRGGDDL